MSKKEERLLRDKERVAAFEASIDAGKKVNKAHEQLQEARRQHIAGEDMDGDLESAIAAYSAAYIAECRATAKHEEVRAKRSKD